MNQIATKRILILEDDPRVAKALTARLRGAGYLVVSAPDPGFGVIMAATHPPDLIISDIWMPVMQGLHFMRQKDALGLPRVPVIFITASRQEGLWETAMNLGAAGYFEKPYDPDQLLRAVARSFQPAPAAAARPVAW